MQKFKHPFDENPNLEAFERLCIGLSFKFGSVQELAENVKTQVAQLPLEAKVEIRQSTCPYIVVEHRDCIFLLTKIIDAATYEELEQFSEAVVESNRVVCTFIEGFSKPSSQCLEGLVDGKR
ncbi:MAG: hypothetical protein JOZ78_10140 [Chroococcidiopsidaceae cyanobacterium CP_BM_ER_R8_30]|nr:hypothetical protein [Chroococcidiopsidaceae cyanobacterium CP_BM_ER_R8_30]